MIGWKAARWPESAGLMQAEPRQSSLRPLSVRGPIQSLRCRGRRLLSCAPVIGFLFVVQVPNARDMGCMAILLRPFDSLALRPEGGEDMVGVASTT